MLSQQDEAIVIQDERYSQRAVHDNVPHFGVTELLGTLESPPINELNSIGKVVHDGREHVRDIGNSGVEPVRALGIVHELHSCERIKVTQRSIAAKKSIKRLPHQPSTCMHAVVGFTRGKE
jgi:hypothetical protein